MIDAKSQALAQAAQKLGEKVYAEAEAAQAAAGAGAAPGAGEAKQESAKKDDGNVVDAEFTEVKDGKK